MLDLLIASWRRQRESLVEQLDRFVTLEHVAGATRTIKRIAKLDARISTAEELRHRYYPAREPSVIERASAIAALVAEGGRV